MHRNNRQQRRNHQHGDSSAAAIIGAGVIIGINGRNGSASSAHGGALEMAASKYHGSKTNGKAKRAKIMAKKRKRDDGDDVANRMCVCVA